jgi:hypothetical protein
MTTDQVLLLAMLLLAPSAICGVLAIILIVIGMMSQ